MAFKRRGSLLAVFGAILAAATLIWLDSSVISARTRVIGSDRITSFEALPDPNTELCTMPGMETASLPAAIHAMETLPQPGSDALVCAAPMVATSSGLLSTTPVVSPTALARAAMSTADRLGGPRSQRWLVE